MNAHDRATSLAAIGLDFPLSGREQGELDEHLTTCPACRRAVADLRADALSLRRIAAVAPAPRLRAAFAEALTRPERVTTRLLPDLRPYVRLAMVAALVAALSVGLIASGLFSGGHPVATATPAPQASGIPQAAVGRTFATCGPVSVIRPEPSEVLVICSKELDRIVFAGTTTSRLATGVADAVVDGDAIWAVGTDALVELDRATGAERARVPEAGGDAIAVGAASVWVVRTSAGTVTRVDPTSHRILATIAVGESPEAILVAYGQVWVSDRGSNSVSEIDPASNTVRATIEVGYSPLGMAAAAGRIWVADNETGEVSRVDPATAAADTVPVAPASVSSVLPAIAAAGDTSVWVVDAHAGVLVEIDAPGSRIVRSVAVPGIQPAGNGITAIAADGTTIWVADEGGMLREVTPPPRP